MSVIIGIDPGSYRTGWGVVAIQGSRVVCRGFGVIELSEKLSLPERLSRLNSEMRKLVTEFKPEAMVVEKIFMGKNADSAFKLGHARGVILAVAGAARLRVVEQATRYVKKVLTGNGGASKEQVQFMIQNLLNVRTDQLDATDALALAICHSREVEVEQSMSRHAGRVRTLKEKPL